MRLLLLLALLLPSLGCGNKSGPNSATGEGATSQANALVNSAFRDPDASVTEGQPFEEIPTFEGEAALDTTAAVMEEPPASPRHLTIAEEFADDPATEELEGGVVENPNNRSPEIDGWLSALGVPLGLPYCAAFVSFCLEEAGNIQQPTNRSAGARTFINSDSFMADMCAKSLALAFEKCTAEVEARVVLRGVTHVRPGTLVIWKRKRDPDDWKGHIGMVRDWEGHKGKTVEGNTSSGVVGNQADGGGIYLRERELKIGSWFRITHFTPVVLAEDASGS